MKTVRSIARWGSLLAMIVGAAASAGVSALVTACGGDSETGEKKPPGEDAGTDASLDADADADASASPDVILNTDAPTPTNDVSLDTIPAE